MPWALLDDNFPNHPKVKQAVRQHALARDLFVCVLCYCRRFQTGGLIQTAAVKEDSGFMGSFRKPAAALVAEGLWEVVPGGFKIHDYEHLYDDTNAKVASDDKRRKKQDAGRKGGVASWASRSKQSEADASKVLQQDSKQTAEADIVVCAEAHRDGVVLVPEVLQSSSEKENGQPHFDEWVRELQQDYPLQRVTSGHLTEKAFMDALLGESDGPVAAWKRMRDNLENQKRGHEWRVKRLIPKLDNWLRGGAWKQQHDEHPPSTLVNEKTERTLSSAAAFIKAGER